MRLTGTLLDVCTRKESDTDEINSEYIRNASRRMLMASLQVIAGNLSGKGHCYVVSDTQLITRFAMQQTRKDYKGRSQRIECKGDPLEAVLMKSTNLSGVKLPATGSAMSAVMAVPFPQETTKNQT